MRENKEMRRPASLGFSPPTTTTMFNNEQRSVTRSHQSSPPTAVLSLLAEAFSENDAQSTRRVWQSSCMLRQHSNVRFLHHNLILFARGKKERKRSVSTENLKNDQNRICCQGSKKLSKPHWSLSTPGNTF